MRDFSRGAYEGIVSLLAIKELIKILRELFVSRGVTDKTVWMREEGNLIRKINKLSGIKVIEGRPDERKNVTSTEDMMFGNISHDALDVMLKYGGSSKWDDYEKAVIHDGLHPMDALHVVIAVRMGCGKIVTFDHDFEETKNEVYPIVL